MKSKLSLVIFIVVITALVNSCGVSLKVPIDKNKLSGNFTMEIPSKNIVIKNNEYFNLSALGLEANSPTWNGKLARITTINYAMKAFKKNKYTNYDVIIKNPDYPKPYYGKIAFFNTNKKNESAAVSRYREISIEPVYFSDATRGRTAILYEYFEATGMSATGTVFKAKIPTWILIMSDEPF
ncbi:MAG TPA: hypothetical protein VHD35_16240 [Chitinophagaceae bacterium]|nr:hypothetical protein [Chitinophagaceae bacterium]